MVKVFIGTLRELAQNLGHFVRKRTRSDDAILRAFKLRSRNHLHGFRNLLRVLDRLNAPADVEKIGHRLIKPAAAPPRQLPALPKQSPRSHPGRLPTVSSTRV